MALSSGTRIGPYEIRSPIGAGGMGEVYRARDTKLERDVAIKVLPDAFASEPERLARFEREAKLLASLNHPNIASIHGFEESDGVSALVLELVEGPTLAERIEEGPVPVDEALAIARQIAEALEAGHRAGVIHRDLKPANIKLTEDGTVKVLDYGLAKALEGETAAGADPELSHSPTLTRQTQVGVILGTAAYMSPEQAKGKAVDPRTDLFSFGVVLYEMLTGEKAFSGGDAPEVLASVINREPEWNRLPSGLDPRVHHVVRRCLRKDRNQRLQAAGDARVEIDDVLASPVVGTDTTIARPMGGRVAVAWGLSVLAAAFVGAAIAWNLAPEPERRVTRLVVGTEASPAPAVTGALDLAVAPDGRSIAYRAGRELLLRPADQLDAIPLFRALSGFGNPFFSPDGRWVGFSTFDDQSWKKVSVLGGPPVTLFPSTNAPRGASWAPDDTIIFAANAPGTGLFRGHAAGGEPEILTTPDTDSGEIFHRWPEILPGGDAVLFTVVTESMQIAVLDLRTGEKKLLLPSGSNPRYASTGHIVYGVDGTLLAVAFDADRLELTGDPVPVLEGVMTNDSGAVEFGLSTDGSLVYLAGDAEATSRRSLVWVDREGREELVAAEPRAYRAPRISPDGRRLALQATDEEDDIWIWDFARETMSRLTFDSADESSPVWTPDGDRIAFASNRDGITTLYWKAGDGTGVAERLTESDHYRWPAAFTPSGEHLVYEEALPDARRLSDLGVLSLGGDRASEPLLATEFVEANPEISPDGRWIAYQSDQAGRSEIYVRPFPNVDEGLHPISAAGGTHPVWARDGSELFYLDPRGRLTAVSVRAEPGFESGSPEVILEQAYYATSGTAARSYDVSPDGERFLMIRDDEEGDDTPRTEIILVQNWLEELKQLVPVD